MRTVAADIAVVGSGVTGLLASQGPLASGKSVVMLERGGMKTHAEQLADGVQAADVPGAAPNDETAPGSSPYPWDYLYGVGGSTLHWSGVAPRFSATDMRMHSAFGVMSDWPISYEDVLPFYRRAERILGVAGVPDTDELTGGHQPPHPFSPMDDLIADHLQPYLPLPQARPTRDMGSRPACCGAARCDLCPVDSRFSPLNGLEDVIGNEDLTLLTQTAASRVTLEPGGSSVEGLDAVTVDREPVRIVADAYVLAAGGFENPAILLRSGLGREDVGRFLFDHAHRTLHILLDADVRPGEGATISTGITEAFRDGEHRAHTSAAYVSAFNPGIGIGGDLVTGLSQGWSGKSLRESTLERWRHTLPLDVLLEDVPQSARRVSLGSGTDAFGLPNVRVSYPDATDYELRGRRWAREGLEACLSPLGVREVQDSPGPGGSHLLGTCRMGDGDTGVVDAEQRHLDVENLFVAGGSAFPTYTPAHPTLTICALAIRLGETLQREL